jgi:hypothetical protein
VDRISAIPTRHQCLALWLLCLLLGSLRILPPINAFFSGLEDRRSQGRSVRKYLSWLAWPIRHSRGHPPSDSACDLHSSLSYAANQLRRAMGVRPQSFDFMTNRAASHLASSTILLACRASLAACLAYSSNNLIHGLGAMACCRSSQERNGRRFRKAGIFRESK